LFAHWRTEEAAIMTIAVGTIFAAAVGLALPRSRKKPVLQWPGDGVKVDAPLADRVDT
jgi:hypothetical protein